MPYVVPTYELLLYTFPSTCTVVYTLCNIATQCEVVLLEKSLHWDTLCNIATQCEVVLLEKASTGTHCVI